MAGNATRGARTLPERPSACKFTNKIIMLTTCPPATSDPFDKHSTGYAWLGSKIQMHSIAEHINATRKNQQTGYKRMSAHTGMHCVSQQSARLPGTGCGFAMRTPDVPDQWPPSAEPVYQYFTPTICGALWLFEIIGIHNKAV
jgi:hypothetical protein